MKDIFNVQNCSYLQKSEPHFSMSHAEKQTEAAKYELSRRYHITVWSGEIDLDWQSKPHCYCLHTQKLRFCNSIFLSQLTNGKWTLISCLLQQYQLWEGLPPSS